jgi:hypothetical protein
MQEQQIREKKETFREEKKSTQKIKKISSDSLRYFHFRFHFPLIASSFPMSYVEDREERKRERKIAKRASEHEDLR